MNRVLLLSFFILLTSCASPSKNKTSRFNNTVIQSTNLELPPAEPVKVAYHEEEDDEDENEEEKEVLAANVNKLIPEIFIEGVAIPDPAGLSDKQVYYLEGAEELKLKNNYFDIPVVYNKQVKKWIDYFTGRGRKHFSNYTERAGRYAPMIGAILEKNGLPRDLIFLAMAESGFNNHARSHAKAVGPWQFMPATGKDYSLNQNWYIDERKDPVKATIAAARYLGKLYEDFGAWEIATAAYNAGEGKVGRAIRKYKTKDFWKLTRGKYLKSETKNYVPKIMALAIIGKNLSTFGFHEIDFKEPLDYKEVTVRPMTDILRLSTDLKINAEEIYRLNPEILRWFTPPDVKFYKLRLPSGSLAAYNECCLKSDYTSGNFQTYKVPRNMSLLQVSKKFRLKNALVLSHLNSLSPRAKVKKGFELKLPFKIGEKIKLAVEKIKYHKVKRGESLYSIAKKHKTSVSRIIAYNSLRTTKKLYPGTRLVIR